MQTVILIAIGAVAVYYVVRLLWKEVKGELPCNCSSNCSAGCQQKDHCNLSKDRSNEDTK